MNGIAGRVTGSVGRRLGYTFGLLTFLIPLCGIGTLVGAQLVQKQYDRIIDRIHPADDDRLHDQRPFVAPRVQ
ncbi:hypothetical protein ACFYO2_09330 [Streptomyces sp. NPDC006602]|uniref:hypothetical protein n=1 Tax=Streptomyces sp. NPDC006602 TaxID=3364751 RepID=UPI00369A292C